MQSLTTASTLDQDYAKTTNASEMQECPERRTMVASQDGFWVGHSLVDQSILELRAFLLGPVFPSHRDSVCIAAGAKDFEAIFGSSRQSRKTRNLDSDTTADTCDYKRALT